MGIPDSLTHYTLDVPFRSLSELPEEEWAGRVAGLSEENALAYARFRHADYLANRVRLEARMREEFVARGGRPERGHPYYLVLGASPWFERHEPDVTKVRISISVLDPAHLSFTYGDSMTSYGLRDGTWPRAKEHRRPHHGRLYLLDEVPALVGALGIPAGPTREKPDHYVEAQLWAEPPPA